MRWLLLVALAAGCARNPKPPRPRTPYEQAQARAEACEWERPGECADYWLIAQHEHEAAERHAAEKRARVGAAIQGVANGFEGAARVQRGGTHCTTRISGDTAYTDCN
jgi:hypothetical protein